MLRTKFIIISVALFALCNTGATASQWPVGQWESQRFGPLNLPGSPGPGFPGGLPFGLNSEYLPNPLLGGGAGYPGGPPFGSNLEYPPGVPSPFYPPGLTVGPGFSGALPYPPNPGFPSPYSSGYPSPFPFPPNTGFPGSIPPRSEVLPGVRPLPTAFL